MWFCSDVLINAKFTVFFTYIRNKWRPPRRSDRYVFVISLFVFLPLAFYFLGEGGGEGTCEGVVYGD